jgi:small basic protein
VKLIPVVALFIGVVFGFRLSGRVPEQWEPYLSISVLAGLDSIVGGLRAHLDGRFYPEIFLTGFVAILAAALGLGWLGELLTLNLFAAAAVVFCFRLFQNLGQIRRLVVNRAIEAKARRQLEAQRDSQNLSSSL